MPPRINYTRNSGASRWITIGLVAVLLTSAAFVAWAVYGTKYNQDSLRRLVGINGGRIPTPPKFNCPLDGTPVPNRAAADKRPIVVQVDNAPGARPQSGLSQADIVYEEMAEGDVTRFSAIFACREVNPIGPVRSARLIDLELVPEYNALLSNSGSSEGVTAALESSPDVPNINHSSYSEAYWRADDRAAPHDLMSSTEGLRQAAAAAGIPITAAIPSLTFKDDTPAPAVKSIGVRYSAIVDINYQYDAGSNSWLRFLDGEPHEDAATGKQLAVRNVIMQYTDVTESGIEEDAGGSMGLIFGLTGTGRVQIFRDGAVYEGTWKRDSKNQVTSYLDAAGKPIPLNRGLTFVQVVPGDFQTAVS